MNKNKSGLAALLIGLALLAGAWLLLKLIPEPDAPHWRVIPFLALGVGCGVFGTGAGELLAAASMKSTRSCRSRTRSPGRTSATWPWATPPRPRGTT